MGTEKKGGGLVRCPACKQECFVLVQPRYEGFRRVGEERACSGCGAVIEATAVRRAPPPPALFGEEDRTPLPDVFRDDERGRLCRYCAHYVVNPFRQWCALHRRDVEATETCPQFKAAAADGDADGDGPADGPGQDPGPER